MRVVNQETSAQLQRLIASGVFMLGNVLADQERWHEALAAYEQALDRGWPQAWLTTGHVLTELGDLAGAMHAYQQAAQHGDSDGDVYRAFLLREQGEQEAAEHVMARAAQVGNAQAAGVLACWAWDATGDLALEDALRAGAEHYPSARACLAALLRATSRDEEAQAVLERGTHLGEQVCWLPLGNLYDEVLDDQQAAERAYRSGIKAGDAYSHHNLAPPPGSPGAA
jgi:tetratricopeptide (TPR) repeat protein